MHQYNLSAAMGHSISPSAHSLSVLAPNTIPLNDSFCSPEALDLSSVTGASIHKLIPLGASLFLFINITTISALIANDHDPQDLLRTLPPPSRRRPAEIRFKYACTACLIASLFLTFAVLTAQCTTHCLPIPLSLILYPVCLLLPLQLMSVVNLTRAILRRGVRVSDPDPWPMFLGYVLPFLLVANIAWAILHGVRASWASKVPLCVECRMRQGLEGSATRVPCGDEELAIESLAYALSARAGSESWDLPAYTEHAPPHVRDVGGKGEEEDTERVPWV